MAIHWASHRAGSGLNRWIGLGFAIGSLCFFVGPFPGYAQLVGAEADGVTFFVGSLFFTGAALLQAHGAQGADRLPSLIQFAGTIFFNVNTYRAMQTAFDDSQVDRLIWAPELVGSICFLVSGAMAYASVRGVGRVLHHGTEWRIAAINLAGCVFFMISTIASYYVPKTGDIISLAASNWTTGLGALCFLIGALLLRKMPEGEPAGG
ncbi:MAG TPA: hypothetical protein VKA36_00905 [Solirubrobacterales bacterium]|nr:hypothetical protein [Solirubrobacterales bacterium]